MSSPGAIQGAAAPKKTAELGHYNCTRISENKPHQARTVRPSSRGEVQLERPHLAFGIGIGGLGIWGWHLGMPSGGLLGYLGICGIIPACLALRLRLRVLSFIQVKACGFDFRPSAALCAQALLAPCSVPKHCALRCCHPGIIRLDD
jgi:hypothetical protein